MGDSVGYRVGRHGGTRLFAVEGAVGRHARRLRERGEPFFARHGPAAVFLARWFAWLRMATPFLAGASAMPYRRFLRWNALGGALWAVSIGLLAYALENVARHLVTDVALVTALPAALAPAAAGARRRLGRGGRHDPAGSRSMP